MSSSEHCRRAIFQIYSYNVQNLKITRITTFRICNLVYQAGSRRDPKCVFNFLRFFERTLYKSNYIIFILSWCGTHTKLRSKLVDIVTAGSQKIALWVPQRIPFGILRVKWTFSLYSDDGGRRIFSNAVIYLPSYTVSYIRRHLINFLGKTVQSECDVNAEVALQSGMYSKRGVEV